MCNILKSKKLLNVFITVLIVILVTSLFLIIKSIYNYKTAEATNRDLQEMYVRVVKPTTEKPKDIISFPISVDFEKLKQNNSHIVGWIYCPDTPINYPVVKGNDNNWYLRKNLYGKHLASGTIFADYRNGDIGNDTNYILYGHNMKNSSMFGTLKKYNEQSYYDTHPIIYFSTPSYNYIIEIYAGTVVRSDSEIYQPEPPKEIITKIKSNSTFVSTLVIESKDNLITLSTCSSEFNNARYVLIGKVKKV